MRIAVIGSGISGISAAWSLSAQHHVTLYEASDRFGGHSRTLDIEPDDGRSPSVPLPVDTGFIVFNERNYPNLTAFFDVLGIETIDSDMSFAVSADNGAFEYAGRTAGLFPTMRSLGDARRWSIVRGLRRFRSEQRRLAAGLIPDDVTVGEYVRARGYPEEFLSLYLLPLASAVWSGTRNNVSHMPAATFLAFLDNHGLLALSDRPQWRTVAGGSRTYVNRALKEVTAAFTGRAVVSVVRSTDDVRITDRHGISESFDHVVFATHADTTLAMLGEGAGQVERDLLSTFSYDRNEVVLHTDVSAMPANRSVWSSWNAVERVGDDGSMPVSVTYWMNRLQSLDTPTDVLVTLNPGDSIDPSRVLDRWQAMHPQFTPDTERAQRQMPHIQGQNRTWFAGAHLGHGFHEDGIRSGVEVAAALGSPPPWMAKTSSPLLVGATQ